MYSAKIPLKTPTGRCIMELVSLYSSVGVVAHVGVIKVRATTSELSGVTLPSEKKITGMWSSSIFIDCHTASFLWYQQQVVVDLRRPRYCILQGRSTPRGCTDIISASQIMSRKIYTLFFTGSSFKKLCKFIFTRP